MARTKHSERSLAGSKVPRGVVSKAPSKTVRAAKMHAVKKSISVDGTKPSKEGPLRKYRPGTLALREIQKYQRSTELLLRRAPFQRLCRSLLDDLATSTRAMFTDEQTTSRMTRDSLMCLQEAAEAYLIRMTEAAQSLAIHARRKTLFRRDFILLQRLFAKDIERLPFPVRGITTDSTTAFLQRQSWRVRRQP